MRHARQTCGENLCGHARIATGGQKGGATLCPRAPGRTYPEIARQPWLESLMTTARDRSPATGIVKPSLGTPGSIFHQIARRSHDETLLMVARDRSPATDVSQPKCGSPGSPYSNSLAPPDA